jgi:hypothetical protein
MTKNGTNQEARFPKKKRSTPKQTGQTLLKNWRKSDARSCYYCLLPGHIAEDCTTDKGQAAALRVILEWLASTHEYVLPKHDARSAVRAWYRTAAVNKAGLAVPKAGIPAVKSEGGRNTNPVNAVTSDDDSTSESFVLFLFLYRLLLHESRRRGDHRVFRSAVVLWRHPSLSPFNARSGQSTRAGRGRMVDGRVQAATFSL